MSPKKPTETELFATDEDGEFSSSREVPEILCVHELQSILAVVVMDEIGSFCRQLREKIKRGATLDEALISVYTEFENANDDPHLLPIWTA